MLTYFIVQDLLEDSCQDCSYSRWSSHLRCTQSFHFIVQGTESRLEIDSTNNLLHGIIHLNGIGHLLWIKRSDDLQCTFIMGVWEAICSDLCIREVSLIDTSMWNSIPLLVLFGLTKFRGFRTWF